MTLTYEHDIGKVQMNYHAYYLGQRSFCFIKVTVEHRHTHTADRLHYPDSKVVGKNESHCLLCCQNHGAIIIMVKTQRSSYSVPVDVAAGVLKTRD